MIWHYLYQYLSLGKFTFFLLVVIVAVMFGKRFLKFSWPLSTRSTFLIILALGILLRIGWLCYSSHAPQSQWNPKHMPETDFINVNAIELAQRGIWFHGPEGLPDAHRPIGYPIFLALLYRIFGVHLAVAWIANLVLYALSLIFLFQITRKIFDDAVSLISAFFFAIYPMSIYSIKLLTDEHLFLPLWYGGLWLLFEILDGRRLKWDWLWLGLIFGYATMTRTHTIFMPLVVGFAYGLLKRPWSEVLGKIFLVFFVMQLMNVPWVIRNYKVWKEPVLYTATAPYVYAQLNSTANPEGGGHVPILGEPGYSPELDAAYRSGNQGKTHRLASQEMSKWIRQHPIQFLELGTARLLNFMCFNKKSGVWAIWHQYCPGSFDPARPLPKKFRKFLEDYALAFYYVVFFTWLFGCAILIRRWGTLTPLTKQCLLILGVCFLIFFAEHMLIYPDRKYRFPLEPLMLIAAAYFFRSLAWPYKLIAGQAFKTQG